MMNLLAMVMCFALVVALTFVFKIYAQKKQLIDIPNARSSHQTPTPRGGGVSIVLVFLGYVAFLLVQDRLAMPFFGSLLLGGMLVAATGFWDDHQHIAARYRVLLHFLAASVALFFIPSLPSIPFLFWELDLQLLGYPMFAIVLVWLLNLFNFMDGIDGIASVEAMSVAGGGAFILLLHGQFEWVLMLLGLVACVGGFLVWNWPPARIFMGDACSGFLGFVLGLLAIIISTETSMSLWSWLILFGVFVVDASVTLLRRMERGDVWYEAHRSHSYQILSRQWGAHQSVTLAVVLVNGVWLLPFAVLADYFPLYGGVFMVIAFLPLIVGAFGLGAGVKND
ncbi:MAG: glycosyltransferase family 4 protein [Pseudomonadales bacterium]|nr:glycosyltransferase family 4 protein [Pseudomonadales bacterium]